MERGVHDIKNCINIAKRGVNLDECVVKIASRKRKREFIKEGAFQNCACKCLRGSEKGLSHKLRTRLPKTIFLFYCNSYKQHSDNLVRTTQK